MSAHWNYQPLNPEFRTPTSNKIHIPKPLYNSMMPQQFYSAKLSAIEDKKLVKQLIKHFSDNSHELNKSDLMSRILNFNANVQDIQLENIDLNEQVMKYKQDVGILKGQVRNMSGALKQKENQMLLLKGKLYEKDESLKELNHKLNKIIEAIQSTPNQQCSFSIEDIPKLVIEEENESDMSLTIPQTPSQESIKLIELEAENRYLKQKISTMQSQMSEKSKQIASNEELEKIVSKLNTLIFEKNELDLKFSDCQKQMRRLRQQNKKQQFQLSQCYGSDEAQQLKSSIRQLQQKLYNKSKQNQNLNLEIVKLKQSDKIYKDRVDEVNRVNNLFNQERKKIESLINENKFEIEKLIRENQSLRTQNSRLVFDINILKRQIEHFVRNSANNGFSNTANVGSNREEQLIKKNKRLQNALEQLKTNMEQFQHRNGNEIRALEAKLSHYQTQQNLQQK